MKEVVILGSTGSIGTQALDIVRRNPGLFSVVGLQAWSNHELLRQQVDEFGPRFVVASDERIAVSLDAARCCRLLYGRSGLLELASLESDITLVAISGTAAVEPVLAALRSARRVALANKESVVCAGPILKRSIREGGAELIPVDSEHSAIFQCLRGARTKEVRRILLTASGGPFRGWSRQQMSAVTADMALAHPRWKMGAKITVDSATLMNKGLEVIEAHHLFDVDYSAIEVVVHPQSIVHSMVEFSDGSVLAQLGTPDMRVPI